MERLIPRAISPGGADQYLRTIGGETVWSDGPAPSDLDLSVHTLDELADVDTTANPPDLGDLLGWNGTGWVPVTPPADLTGRHREVLMASGVTPPEPLVSSDGYDWLYGEAPA